VLGYLPEPGYARWSLYGRLVPADSDLFAELLALVQDDTGSPDDDDTPGRRWDIEVLVEVDGEPHELIELRSGAAGWTSSCEARPEAFFPRPEARGPRSC
jgi:hypothetical protein